MSLRHFLRRLLCACTLLLAPGLVFAAQTAAPAATLDTVHLQLRWKHQFQFAGYYAAVEKGYYREEGLDVVLHAGAPDRQPVSEVLSGRAQYAEGNSEVLLARLQGQPLVALAAIFQHSPSVLLTLRSSGIASPKDLAGKRVMFVNGMNDADFMAMLHNEGVARERLTLLPSSYDVEDLVRGKVDAFNSYLTNEPYFLKQRGIEYTVINPINSRVDFYSDILFTSEDELRHHPARVAAMRRATLKGWRYAMDQPDEIIELLLTKYQVPKTREHLEYEARTMRPLVLPDLVPIGHMSPERWEHMADTFALTGLISRNYSIEGFMYEDPSAHPLPPWLLPLLGAAVLVGLVVALAAWLLQRCQRSLQHTEAELRAVREQLEEDRREISALQQRLQEQVVRDPLTGLYHRHYLDETLEHEVARAKREGYPISVAVLDIDRFKHVNDTYGHKAGDEVLKAVAELLQDQAREGDIACRYGGEEFLLLMPRQSLAEARERAEQWRTDFATHPVRHGDLALAVTLSIGVATYPEHAASPEALVLRAERALSRAKAQGRNRVELAEAA